jgi:glycosyltransferase involved in cell wall biosynthesis
MPLFSIVTTCMGRLDNLKRTIPRMASQKNTELVVVDYNCPQGTGEFVRQNYPRAKVVSERVETQFNLARARNLGAAQAEGEIIAFLDADVIVSENFSAELEQAFERRQCGRFPVPDASWNGIVGSCVVERSNWLKVSGYDDVLKGRGGNDRDFYFRLELVGCRSVQLPRGLVEGVIETPPAKMTEFYSEKDRFASVAINQAYRQIKNMLLRESGQGELERPLRQMIHKTVEQDYYKAKNDGRKEFSVMIEIPHDGTFSMARHHDISRLAGVKVRINQG